MAALTLAEFIDRAMKRMHTNSVKLSAETGIKASWIRNFKSGRIKTDPDEDNLRALAKALNVDEAEFWRYLDRMDRVAALRGEPLRGDSEPMPEWAIRLEKKVDALNALLGSVGNRVDGSARGLATILAALSKAADPQPEQKPVAPAAPPRPLRTRKKRPGGGPRPSWGEEVDHRQETRAL